MELTWILIFLFAFCTMVFLALAVFLPEWVGISRRGTSTENTTPEKTEEQLKQVLDEHSQKDK